MTFQNTLFADVIKLDDIIPDQDLSTMPLQKIKITDTFIKAGRVGMGRWLIW